MALHVNVSRDKTMMTDKRSRLEPPDLAEKGGMKGGQPQRSDERLFMQLLVFTGCADPAPVVDAMSGTGADAVVYEDLNDAQGVAVLTLERDPNAFIDIVRPALKSDAFSRLTPRPDLTMFGRTYSLGYE